MKKLQTISHHTTRLQEKLLCYFIKLFHLPVYSHLLILFICFLRGRLYNESPADPLSYSMITCSVCWIFVLYYQTLCIFVLYLN